MTRDDEKISRRFSEYVAAFQTLDPGAPLPFCHVPCVFMSAQGMRVMASSSEIEVFFAQVMQGLRARNYARSSLRGVHVMQMSDGAALVSVSRVRYRADGGELERLGETYTLLKTADEWKIAAALVHDVDTAL